MTDTTDQVVEQPAPDAIASDLAETPIEEQAESSTAVNDADESPDHEPKKSRGVQVRIDELTRNWREAERREAALLDMLQRQQTPAKPEAVVEDKPKPTPKLEDFNYDEAAYQAALFQHVKDEAARAAREELRQEKAREQEQAKKQTFKQRETDFAKANPDYFAITRDPSLPFTRELVELVSESEKGPELFHHLAKNRDLVERLSGLSLVAAAREVGRLEAKLDVPPPAPALKPAVSKAPPPPPKIDATDATPTLRTTDASGDAMSDAEWVKAESARLARKVKRNA
jgi:hypothetical protein